jgi:hypothetical protein
MGPYLYSIDGCLQALTVSHISAWAYGFIIGLGAGILFSYAAYVEMKSE